MNAASAPIEWIPGKSRWPWVFGMVFVLVATMEVALAALEWGLSWAGVAPFSSKIYLVLDLASIAIGVGPMFIWAILVPFPAPQLGVHPDGVIINFGGRKLRLPRNQVSLRGTHLAVVSPKGSARGIYALTPLQASRILALVRPSV